MVEAGVLKNPIDTSTVVQWFVMRDLTRSNAKMPAYKMLQERGVRCFTPMTEQIIVRNGRRVRCVVPYIHDLVFVCGTRDELDPIVARVATLQYRYLRGRVPMTVRNEEMERFIQAVGHSESIRYYRPEEITPDMRHRKIRIIGGQLDGLEGSLLTVRGSKTRRLLVEIPSLLAASVEVNPEFIQLL